MRKNGDILSYKAQCFKQNVYIGGNELRSPKTHILMIQQMLDWFILPKFQNINPNINNHTREYTSLKLVL